jgi:hypothetical protein
VAAAALTARFRGLPRPFYALFGATLVNRLGGVVDPFLALYLAHRDYQAVFGTAFSGGVHRRPRHAALLDAAGGRALRGACGAVGIAAALGQLALGPAIARRTDGQ